jgi:hypothetical protein
MQFFGCGMRFGFGGLKGSLLGSEGLGAGLDGTGLGAGLGAGLDGVFVGANGASIFSISSTSSTSVASASSSFCLKYSDLCIFYPNNIYQGLLIVSFPQHINCMCWLQI